MSVGSELNGEIVAFIVRRYACYEDLRAIREAIREEFGRDVPKSEIRRWDLSNEKKREKVAKQWADLFDTVRERFQMGLDDVGVVWRPYRLQRLDEMEREARHAKNFTLAASLLEQAAREVGGYYEKSQGISLEALQREIDKMASAVAAEVTDPDVLQKIEERWNLKPE